MNNIKICLAATLLSSALCVSMASARPLKSGTTGSDVKQWQSFLNTRGFDIKVDGKFGSSTKRATILFQKKWKLTADGIAGAKTIEKARSLGFQSSQTSPSKGKTSPSKSSPSKSASFPYNGRWTDQRRLILDVSGGKNMSITYYNSLLPNLIYDMQGSALHIRVKFAGHHDTGSYYYKDWKFVPRDGGAKMQVFEKDTEYYSDGKLVTDRAYTQPDYREVSVLVKQWND